MNRQQQIERFLLAAHRLAVARLRDAPERIEPVKAQLARWRLQSGPTRSDPYWDEWDDLLNLGADDLERIICAETDHAALLRSVSPISVLLTQRERARLLSDARASSS